jgi:hypothetical protein
LGLAVIWFAMPETRPAPQGARVRESRESV